MLRPKHYALVSIFLALASCNVYQVADDVPTAVHLSPAAWSSGEYERYMAAHSITTMRQTLIRAA